MSLLTYQLIFLQFSYLKTINFLICLTFFCELNPAYHIKNKTKIVVNNFHSWKQLQYFSWFETCHTAVVRSACKQCVLSFILSLSFFLFIYQLSLVIPQDLSNYTVSTRFVGISVPTKVVGMLMVSVLPTKIVGMLYVIFSIQYKNVKTF